jgi:TolA-binding protein
MADKNANEHASAGQAGTGSAPDEKAGVGAPAIPWKKVWPLPALIAGTTLFMGGAYMAIKTRPRPDPTTPLKLAESLVEARKFEEAIKVLNTDVKRFVDLGSEAGVTKAHKAAYHLAMARSFSGAQEQLGFSRAENHRAVVEQYQRAEELGVEIHGADVTRIVESLIALGKIEEALRRVRALPLIASAGSGGGHGSPAHTANSGHSEHSDGEGAKAEGESGQAAVEGGAPEGDGLSEAERRVRLTKLVVEANLKSPTPRDDLTLELLAELGGMPRLSDTDRVWVLARQAELLLAAGRAEDAIVKLLPRIRVRAGAESAPEAEGELYLLLGRAYFDAGQNEAATRQLIEASRLLGEFNPKRAETDLILGKILQSTGDLEGAKERFSLVVQEFSSTPNYLPALLGLAEVEGAVGGSSASAGDDTNKELESSIERYAQIVEASKTSAGVPRTVSRERVTSSLMERYQDRFQSGDLRNALRFAQLAESIYADEDVPGVVHMALARAHRRVADQTLGAAQEKGGPDFKITDLNAVERTEIKQHYLAAAGHFKAYAGLVAAVDNRAYGDALWSAGDSFDLAGDLEEAKRVFSAYADGASDDDARKPESRFRLAQVFQAQRDYASAAGVYRSLLDGGGGSSRGSIWGDQSIVPLARCILSDSDAGNDDEAEALLLSVVDGNEASPDGCTTTGAARAARRENRRRRSSG